MQIGIRIAADVLMVSVCLLGAFMVRYIWIVGVHATSTAAAHSSLSTHLYAYAKSVVILVPLSIAVFYVSGFYTHGRAYQSRFKALIVAQAVTISHLIMATLVFFLGGLVAIPRSVLLMSWVSTGLVLIGARVWSALWRSLTGIEARVAPAVDDNGIGRVLVIGGAGYIGSRVVPRLLAEGYTVRVLDLILYGKESIAEVMDHPNLEIIEADFRQVDKVVEALQDVDAVIHLGAIVGDPACKLNTQATIEVNLVATRMIAQAAKGYGVKRFVFASTCSVYGASNQVLDERSKLNPVSLYARSKIGSERVLRELADEYFAPVILRFGTIYGLSGRCRFDLVVNLLTAKAITEREITLYDGEQWRPFVHVDDVARAIVCTLQAPVTQVSNQIFNVGSWEQNYRLKEVAERIQQHVPDAEAVEMGSDEDRRNYRVKFSKIRRVLDFTPQWGLDDGIREIVTAFATGEISDYRDVRYSNVRYLKEHGLEQLEPQEGWIKELLMEAEEVETEDVVSAGVQVEEVSTT